MENKINIARFKEDYRTAEVKDIWQWDYGQILRIQGLNLPTAVEIHFSLDEHGGEAARRIGVTKDGVTDVPIPDSMVENESAYGDSYYFFAYVYLSDEESGNTEYKIRAKVSTRSRPEGYVSGGNDTFAEILKTVNEIADDKVTRPETAKVGQVLSVKATDEDGKPTEFEAVNQSGGASEEEIRQAVEDYLTENPIEETDPTVPNWAKQPEKPTYTASEVGALPAGTKIPQSASEVGADAAGTAEGKVSAHNTSDMAHNDIRLLVQGLTKRLDALADSDDETLDQMSEIVAYIKSNKSLIDAITTGKVSVSDIIDNLTTNVSNKPLSAAQGVKLKRLIDEIVIPTTLPNPKSLTFTGAVTGSYDGSEEFTVNIPSGGGESGGNNWDDWELVSSLTTTEDTISIMIEMQNRYTEMYVSISTIEKMKIKINFACLKSKEGYRAEINPAVNMNENIYMFRIWDAPKDAYVKRPSVLLAGGGNAYFKILVPTYASSYNGIRIDSYDGTTLFGAGTIVEVYGR